jgi:hypothetical protein
MDALTTAVRDALVAEGLSPATADELAQDFAERTRKRREREKRENLAQQLLPLGREVAALRIGCHPNYVYNLAAKARRRFSVFREQKVTANP